MRLTFEGAATNPLSMGRNEKAFLLRKSGFFGNWVALLCAAGLDMDRLPVFWYIVVTGTSTLHAVAPPVGLGTN